MLSILNKMSFNFNCNKQTADTEMPHFLLLLPIPALQKTLSISEKAMDEQLLSEFSAFDFNPSIPVLDKCN